MKQSSLPRFAFLLAFLLAVAILFFQLPSFARGMKSSLQASPSSAAHPPKLVLTIVIDQFRADTLLRWRDRFVSGGFRRLMDQGAVYPFAQYPVLQNMTCPGHSMILTGSVPAQNHIPLNDWYDPKLKKTTYCVDDDKDGISPRRLEGDTLGDEMKLHWSESKVVTVSFKDRAAVMLGGHAADAAYWFNDETLKFESSSYYRNRSGEMDSFVPKSLPALGTELIWKNSKGSRNFEHKMKWGTKEGFSNPITLDLTLAATEKALEIHHLGQHSTPDLLAVSFSTHDFIGHRYGPDSAEVEDLTLYEDLLLAQLFKIVEKRVPGGMKNVWVMFTADHGASPLAEHAIEVGIEAGRISQKDHVKELNAQIAQAFGACADGWVAGYKSFNFYYSPACLQSIGAKKVEMEKEAIRLIKTWPGVAEVFSRTQFDNAHYPANWESALKKSYVPGISGDLVLIPRPFWYEADGAPSTHMTSYNYDRSVPLVLMGSAFKKGVYSTPAQVIDAAPTLAFALRILAPSLSEGRVLSEIIVPERL